MNQRGQMMIAAIGILLLLAIIIPAMVRYTQDESIWTVKQQRTTHAFQLAEGAVERGHQQLLISSSTWFDLQSGMSVSGFNFDQTYTGIAGGEYEIRMAAGPMAQQVTIVGIGRSRAPDGKKELRAVKAVYSNSSSADNAVTAGNTVTIGASVNVEWGAVMSYTSINSGGRNHPRFYSAGNVDLDANGSTAPNTDNTQWWSYQTNLPTAPQVDLQYYKALAQSYGASPAGCPSYYSNPGTGVNTNVTGCQDNSGRTYYFETGDWTWKNPGPNFINGNIIIASGNMSISGNGGTGAALGTYSATIPPQAWKEYGNNWALYQCFDGSAPATFAAATAAAYLATGTHTIPSACVNSAGSVLVHGLVYAGGGAGLNGGGNARFHGVVITPNTVSIATSNYTIYFDNAVAAAVRTTSLSLSRSSWKDLSGCSWSGAHATCP